MSTSKTKDQHLRIAESLRIARGLRDAGYFVTDSNRHKWQSHSNEYVRSGSGSTFELALSADDKHPIRVVLSNSRESYCVQYRE